MRAARPVLTFICEIRDPPFGRHEFGTSDAIKVELFGSLRYLSEVEQAGIVFFKQHGHGRRAKQSYVQFRAFLRQAETFYDGAEVLHYRASPLNYYYSFLNLAKAFITIHDPSFVAGKVTHGIIYKHREHELSRQMLVSQRTGVFPKFYQLASGQALPQACRFSIARLLAYCTDVSVEYQQGGFGSSSNVHCKLAIIGDQHSKHHPLLATVEFERLEPFKKSMKPFWEYFEEVKLPNADARGVFGIMGERQHFFRYFESKQQYPLEPNNVLPTSAITKDVYSALRKLFAFNPYKDEFDFILAEPLKRNLQIPMNETLAIYLVTFFLSSLVRYHPAYLEGMLASRDAWIIERFARSAPITFLRHIRNLIHDSNYIYFNR